MEDARYDIVKLHAYFLIKYLFLYTGYESPNTLYDILFCFGLHFLMDCVFMVKLFYLMVVTSDKISGRRTLFWMTWMQPVCLSSCEALRCNRKAIKGDDGQI